MKIRIKVWKLTVLVLLAIMAAPLVYAGTSDNLDVALTVSSGVPVILNVTNTTTLDQDAVESSTVDFTALVAVFDENNVDDISNVNMSVFATGQNVTRWNTSCGKVGNLNTTTANYSCTVALEYYDKSAEYTITIVANDSTPNEASNNTVKFLYGSLEAWTMSPGTIDFGPLSVGSAAGATDDPIVLTNTGNYNVSATEGQVTAIDLKGDTDADKSIQAANFTANVADSSGGDALVNDTATAVTGFDMPRGDAESLYFWIESVPSVMAQAYSQLAAWSIDTEG